MDSLIRERNGKEEVWYSAEYLKNQMEIAYQAGISKGIKVEIHAIQPMDGECVNNLIDEFNKRRAEEYQKYYSNGEVWRIAE
jgi:ADP-dependent phosphofructokinase/glucokinase